MLSALRFCRCNRLGVIQMGRVIGKLADLMNERSWQGISSHLSSVKIGFSYSRQYNNPNDHFLKDAKEQQE